MSNHLWLTYFLCGKWKDIWELAKSRIKRLETNLLFYRLNLFSAKMLRISIGRAFSLVNVDIYLVNRCKIIKLCISCQLQKKNILTIYFKLENF
jgi:hypothetical protein